jgi:two-component system phosphate regulon sensor histidine kinase PhoR
LPCGGKAQKGNREVPPLAKMPRNQALLIAIVPTACLVAAFGGTGVIEPAPAVAILVFMAIGGAWLFRRLDSGEMAVPETPAPPTAPIPQDVLESLPDPVILLNRAREIIAVNRAARDVLGVGLLGRDLTHSLRHPDVLAVVETVLAGVPSFTEEISLPVPVARTFTLHAGSLPDTGDPTSARVVLVLHDETRAKRAEQSRADFVANASHELRSPLSALIGFIETLRGPAAGDAEARERFLGIMHDEAHRMARLVEDLMSLSRVEINEHVPPREGVDLEKVLNAVVAALAVRAEGREMSIRLECSDSLPMIAGDGDQLIQVFHNLVDNAVKYGRTGTSIRILAQEDKLPGGDMPGVSVAVIDEGDGIPSIHLPRITERFYRVDEGRSRKLGGTGLGLAIVKHIVNRHRGQIKIESEQGRGSTFTVFLPKVEIEAKEEPKRTTSSRAFPGKGRAS